MRYIKYLVAGLAAILLSPSAIASSQNKDINMDEKVYEIPKNCNFMKISNTFDENECTPKLFDSAFFPYLGVLINGPEEVVWPSGVSLNDYPPSPFGETVGPLRLMVAGLIKARCFRTGWEYELYGLAPDVILVAVDQASGEVYYGKMAIPDVLAPPEPDYPQPEFPVSESDRNAPTTSAFNFDLVYDLGLPIADATYTVYATFQDYKSNVLTIKTKVE